MHIVICDDDPLVVQELRDILEEVKGADIVCYPDGESLLARENRVDIAFLDVEMPGITGIQVGAKLKERNPNVKIFIVTAYPDYLDEAMRYQVFRYLSKPIDSERLRRNLSDALHQLTMASREYAVTTAGGVFTYRAEELVCIEAQNRRVLVHTTEGTLQSDKSMDYWREQLTLPCFFQTHRSYIVNMRYVSSIGRDMVTLKYRGRELTAFLTRRRYTTFKDTYLMYMEQVQ